MLAGTPVRPPRRFPVFELIKDALMVIAVLVAIKFIAARVPALAPVAAYL